MSFIRHVEDFTCERCGASVQGDGYTNHCPACLWGKHVDVDPGDRAHPCQGMMRPFASRFDRAGYVIYHRCERCGQARRNRATSSDTAELLISLSAQPITE